MRVTSGCLPIAIVAHGASRRNANVWMGEKAKRPARLARTRSREEGAADTAETAETAKAAETVNNNTESSGDDIQIEQMMASKRKSKKNRSSAPVSAKPYNVVSAQRDAVYGDQPMSQIQQLETAVVQGLGLVFLLILAEGIFLGASGFMSAEMDQLAQDVVYPLFTPTLGLFLAGSTAYGLWKTKEEDKTKE